MFYYFMLFYSNFSPSAPEEPKQETEWEEEAPEISHLHEDDFDDFIQQHSSVLVMFYAPCKLSFFLHALLE